MGSEKTWVSMLRLSSFQLGRQRSTSEYNLTDEVKRETEAVGQEPPLTPPRSVSIISIISSTQCPWSLVVPNGRLCLLLGLDFAVMLSSFYLRTHFFPCWIFKAPCLQISYCSNPGPQLTPQMNFHLLWTFFPAQPSLLIKEMTN